MSSKGYDKGKRTPKIKAREKNVVSKGFHGAGLSGSVHGVHAHIFNRQIDLTDME